EARARGDVNFSRLDFLRGVLPEQILVRVQARLALRLTGARRHADPFELTLESPLTLRLGLLFERQALLFLIEPGGIVALPLTPAAPIELENPPGDVVEEIPSVGDRDDRAGIVLQESLEPRHRLGV